MRSSKEPKSQLTLGYETLTSKASCDFTASTTQTWRPCINAPCLAANSRVKASNKPKRADPSLDEARLEFLQMCRLHQNKTNPNTSTLGNNQFFWLYWVCQSLLIYTLYTYIIDFVGRKPYKIGPIPKLSPMSNTMGSLSTGPCLPKLSSASRRDLRRIPPIDFPMPLPPNPSFNAFRLF